MKLSKVRKHGRRNGQMVRTHLRKVRTTKKGRIIYTRPPQQILALSRRITQALKPHSTRLDIVGSIRRQKPAKDIDIVLIPKDKERIRTYLEHEGTIKASGDKHIFSDINGVQTDVYFATPEDYGAQLLTRTGSAGHNIGLRKLAKEKGMKLNQYGLFKNSKKLAGKTEQEIYKALDRPRFKQPKERD